ncbi:uncharacterized protein LOC131067508 isoform X2 [Cryptomeria japonica]|uniref:uncharacterized protein LOC131067508 isoform X2 n=1 Tax=Cryptomeria japonica TaxID=3369 RepID=UPI0025AC0608|nr:uncharacterized protein LOC131067508 isoform X2 [Cryptomeria japonica]
MMVMSAGAVGVGVRMRMLSPSSSSWGKRKIGIGIGGPLPLPLPLNLHFQRKCVYNSRDADTSPPQEAVLKAISEVSKTEGRVAQTRNVVMGGTISGESEDEWKILDQKVNSYPTVRGFIAIGTGGDDFVQAMVGAVESVLQRPIPEGRVTHKVSSRGKYVSVNIGPVKVVSSDQGPMLFTCNMMSKC